MAMAYAVILVNDDLWKREKRIVTQEAQAAADKRFEKLAQDNLKTRVLRNPEPHVMSYEELRKAMPYTNLDGLTGLYFTADIT